MALAAAWGEVVALRLTYVSAGVFVLAGGLVGLLVFQQPAAPAQEVARDETQDAVEAIGT